MKRLTAKAIENMRPAASRLEIPAGGGLFLLVQPSGRKTFAVRSRCNGKPVKITLKASASELAKARVEAANLLAEIGRGVDPREARRTEEQKAAVAKANTVAAIAALYLEEAGHKLRTRRARESILRRALSAPLCKDGPTLGSMPIDSVRRSHVTRLLDVLEKTNGHRGGPRSADVALAALSRLFRWFALRSDTFTSPVAPGMARSKPAVERARSRTLLDDEIRRVWAACGDAGVFGAGVRLLLLTTARRDEIFHMRRGEVEGNDWELPASRNKAKVPLLRPLPPMAMDILKPLLAAESEYPFVGPYGGPFNDYNRAKKALDKASGVSGWVIHDLRRTGRSLLSRAGINPDTAERCLGHKISGVRGVYDRHAFYNEKKQALEALAGLIERIVNPRDNVTALRR
jgi:integrase